MNIPNFTASASFKRSTRTYHGRYRSASQVDGFGCVSPSQLDIENGGDDISAEQFGTSEQETDAHEQEGAEEDLFNDAGAEDAGTEEDTAEVEDLGAVHVKVIHCASIAAIIRDQLRRGLHRTPGAAGWDDQIRRAGAIGSIEKRSD